MLSLVETVYKDEVVQEKSEKTLQVYQNFVPLHSLKSRCS